MAAILKAVDGAEVCFSSCCVSMFGNPRPTYGTSVIGFDLLKKEVVLPSDYDRGYWKGLIRDERLVCFDCLGDSEQTKRVLVYCESDRHVPYFRHRAGESPEGELSRGETQWHQAMKNGVAKWAERHSTVDSVRLERSTPSGSRRADVGVRLSGGESFALEIQYSPISQELFDARQADYLADGIRPIWFYSSDLLDPPWAGKDFTFAIRLGPVNRKNVSSASYLELGVPFTRARLLSVDRAEAEDFFTFADPDRSGSRGVRWVPLSQTRLTMDGVSVLNNPIDERRSEEAVAAALAAEEHNAKLRPPIMVKRPFRIRSA